MLSSDKISIGENYIFFSTIRGGMIDTTEEIWRQRINGIPNKMYICY